MARKKRLKILIFIQIDFDTFLLSGNLDKDKVPALLFSKALYKRIYYINTGYATFAI